MLNKIKIDTCRRFKSGIRVGKALDTRQNLNGKS